MTTYLQGSEGAANLTADHDCQFNTWSATASHAVHDVTGFGDTGRRRLLGIADLTGSAGGVTIADATGANPGLNSGASVNGSTGASMVLSFRTTSTACTWTFTAVIDSIAASVTAGGDNTVTFNFQLSGGQIVTEAWDES